MGKAYATQKGNGLHFLKSPNPAFLQSLHKLIPFPEGIKSLVVSSVLLGLFCIIFASEERRKGPGNSRQTATMEQLKSQTDNPLRNA